MHVQWFRLSCLGRLHGVGEKHVSIRPRPTPDNVRYLIIIPYGIYTVTFLRFPLCNDFFGIGCDMPYNKLQQLQPVRQSPRMTTHSGTLRWRTHGPITPWPQRTAASAEGTSSRTASQMAQTGTPYQVRQTSVSGLAKSPSLVWLSR